MEKPKRPHTKNFLRQGFPKNGPKVLVYEALAGFNRNFEQVLKDLERLATFDLFPAQWQRRVFKACRATLEETRAWANFELIECSIKRRKRMGPLGPHPPTGRETIAPDDALLPPQPNTGKSRRRK